MPILSLWTTYLALSLAVGAIFSVWAFWRVETGRRDAEAHRTKIMELLEVDPEETENEITREDFNRVEERVEQIVGFLQGDMVGLVEDLKKVAPQIRGAVGGLTKAQNKVEGDFMEGMDALADEQLFKSLPGWQQTVVGQVMEAGNPQAMAMLRKWISTRPDVQASMGVPVQVQATPAPAGGYDYLQP